MTNQPSPIHKTVGPHTLIFEPPDMVLVIGVGVIDAAAATILIEQIVEWTHHEPYLLLLVDVSRLSSFSRDARKVLTSNGHRLPPRALSLFGGSFGVRVLLDMMERASSLLGSKNRTAKHWPSELAARSWLHQMRNELAARKIDR